MKKVIVFDIETAPMEESYLKQIAPKFKAPSNYKSEEAITNSIISQLAAFIADAALSAETGTVAAIGMLNTDSGERSVFLADDSNETDILELFWQSITENSALITPLVGHNIKGFDLPFLARRSRILGVAIPPTLFVRSRGNIYLSDICYDTMDYWSMGLREYIKLDRLARLLGVGSKDDKFGEDFGKFWYKNFKTNPEIAIAYLENDLDLTAAVAAKLGIL